MLKLSYHGIGFMRKQGQNPALMFADEVVDSSPNPSCDFSVGERKKLEL